MYKGKILHECPVSDGILEIFEVSFRVGGKIQPPPLQRVHKKFIILVKIILVFRLYT